MFLGGGGRSCDHKLVNNCEGEEACQECADNNDKVFQGAKVFQITQMGKHG